MLRDKIDVWVQKCSWLSEMKAYVRETAESLSCSPCVAVLCLVAYLCDHTKEKKL